MTAAGTDGLLDRDGNKHSKRHMIESTLAGLATSHFVGGRSKSRGRDGRSKSSGGGGLKDLASAGALAAAGKEIYDRVSRSRSRPRGREGSRDSYDSESDRSRSRRRDDRDRGSKQRSKSVSEYISKGMAALGLEGGGDDRRRERSRSRNRDYERSSSRRRGSKRYDSYSDSDGDDSEYRSRGSRRGGGRDSRDVGRYRSIGRNPPPNQTRSAPRGGPDRAASTRSRGRSSSESDSDLGDSSDEKEKHKKMKRDMLVTSGLATVATIHAAHNVHQGIEKRKKRLQALEEGKITAEEARKRRIKANTLDAASIGLAALGIKGAYSEWQEVNEKRKEHREFQDECSHRHERRLRRARSQGPSHRHRWPDEIESAASPVPSWKYSPPVASIEAPQATY